MDTAYISAFAVLAGTAIGGLASFATSWTTQHAQTRAQRLANERDIRAALFGRFLDEATTRYSDAPQNKRDDITRLVSTYALTNRIRLISSAEVVEASDTVVRIIVDAYNAPNITMEEIRASWIGRHVDPLRDFSNACRRSSKHWDATETAPSRKSLEIRPWSSSLPSARSCCTPVGDWRETTLRDREARADARHVHTHRP